MEDITYGDHKYAKRVWKEFKIKHLGKYNSCTFKVTHYCLQIYLKIFATGVLKYMSLIQLTFPQRQD